MQSFATRTHLPNASSDTPEVNDVANIVIPPQSSKEITLQGLKGDPNLQNSFMVVADGVPGDVVAKLVSKSESRLREVEILGADLMSSHDGGNHPWSVESGTDSILLIFNTSMKPQSYTVAITAGTVTWQKVYELKSMETRAISIRTLIDNGIKDDEKKALPKDIWNGQIDWFTPSPHNGRGRLLQANPETAMARNFSCLVQYELCQLTFAYYDTYQFLFSFTDTFGTMRPGMCANQCSGTPVGFTTSGLNIDWFSGDTAIAKVSGPTNTVTPSLYGQGIGSTYFDGSASDGYGCYLILDPQPPAYVFTAAINSADITTDSISVSLQSPGVTLAGTLTLKLEISSGGSPVTIYSATAGTGTQTYHFGINSIPTGREFDLIYATWQVGDKTATASYHYDFKVLGKYRQTQYNSPDEHLCTGTPKQITIWSTQGGCKGTDGDVKTDFDFRVTDPTTGTGSGHSVNYGDVLQEALCSVGSGDLRGHATIRGSLGSVSNSTVAVCKNNTDLYVSGRRLFIQGEGVKTVADSCPSCCKDITHLDNYTTDTRCTGVTSLPDAITVILY